MVGWWGGVGWRGTAEAASCGPRFAPSMALDTPANPPCPTFDRSMAAREPSVAPTHGRRTVPANGPLRSPTMGRRYRFSFFLRGGPPPEPVRGVGRWGWAGALSAMDGAKRGPHGCSFCRPPTSPTARPRPSNGFQPPARGSHPFDLPLNTPPPAHPCGSRMRRSTPPSPDRAGSPGSRHTDRRRTPRGGPCASARGSCHRQTRSPG
ncbi:hypothetical protein EDF77_0705 [Stenotrophomonas maltophilia]|nr:hypothetical protein EDF77_0705 [Stenotrophomonas maltophilia]